jgi:hypothetical protein
LAWEYTWYPREKGSGKTGWLNDSTYTVQSYGKALFSIVMIFNTALANK